MVGLVGFTVHIFRELVGVLLHEVQDGEFLGVPGVQPIDGEVDAAHLDRDSLDRGSAGRSLGFQESFELLRRYEPDQERLLGEDVLILFPEISV